MTVLDIQKMLLDSIREKNEVKKSILRVLLGQVQQIEKPTEKQINGVMKKLVEGNLEMLKFKKGDKVILEENEILKEMLPPTLTESDIEGKLVLFDSLRQRLIEAPSEGAAIGIAMKGLVGLEVNTVDVVNVVKRIRKSKSKKGGE